MLTLSYSIEAALSSGLFEEVMVSTDDDEVETVARQYGASIPFKRTTDTANDYATLADVLHEVLDTYQKLGERFDNMCCILATSPLVTPCLMVEGYTKLLSDDSLSTVYPIVPFSYPVQRCLQMDENGIISMKWPEYSMARSQDLEPLYHDSGIFYWHKIDLWRSGRIKRGAILMDEMCVQDIDTETDWKLAELKYSILHDK